MSVVSLSAPFVWLDVNGRTVVRFDSLDLELVVGLDSDGSVETLIRDASGETLQESPMLTATPSSYAIKFKLQGR